VVIVGAGFAGLNCARSLASNPGVSVTLIDKNNYQQFQPLLYQVATGMLAPNSAAFNLRDVFSNYERVSIVMAEIDSVDLHAHSVTATTGDVYAGDVLVLAAGAEVNFFGVAGSEQFAFPMYSLKDAEHVRSRLLELLEKADAAGISKGPSDLHFVVVGGGATGVETAGALADIFARIPKHFFPNVDLDAVAISLVDAGVSVLKPFAQTARDYATKILRDRGVVLRLGVSVREITAIDVLLSDGARIDASLVVWAGGLRASTLSQVLGIEPGRGGRVDVAPDLTLTGFPGIYVLGDLANTTGADGLPLPQLAAVAKQAGHHCAANISADRAGKARRAFAYVDRGNMAMVGRNAAVAEIGTKRRPLNGILAFAAWLAVHAVLMTTFRSSIGAMLQWATEYFGSLHVNPILDRPSRE
jgi:NADH dehydrogenase